MTIAIRAAIMAFALVAMLAIEGMAQRPGEIAGTIIDAASGTAVDGASIVLPALGRSTASDAAGRFTLRGLEPGEWSVRVSRLGFAPREIPVIVRNGEIARITIRLAATPLELASLDAAAIRGARDGTQLDRAGIAASGARTAGDALRTVPGVVIRSSGPGSPQHVILRGMGPDAVLVLLDGVPLNDAVTGEADLSVIAATSINSVSVLPGARSARWGPRAAGGVILIESARGIAERRVEIGAGSLGTQDAAIAWGGGGAVAWNAGGSLRSQGGQFDFELPDEVGGGTRRRENADVRSLETHAGASLEVAGGNLDVRARFDETQRGLPGRGFAPSPRARQTSERLQSSVTWRRAQASSSMALLLAGSHQRLGSRDTQPPFGLPYADTTRAALLEARLDFDRALTEDIIAGAGVEVRHQRIAGTLLRGDAPTMQLDAGIFAHADLPLVHFAGDRLRIVAQARLDRDAAAGDVVPSHSVTLGWGRSHIAAHVAHRSSYSPATPGDRFFRDAFGIEPDPDLDAERVPGEIEVGASLRGSISGWATTVRGSAYRGNIRGMILWAPDYRFIWRPYNQNANRVGGEATLELASPGRREHLAVSWTTARATYDRGSGDDDVQIAYRPRHSAAIEGGIERGSTRLDMRARYTGRRTTAPSVLNTLPGFWTLDAGVSYERMIGGWIMGLELRVDRVFDNDDALVFGFPEPGRVARFGVRIAPGRSPSLLSIGARP
jgi:outer membrane cobalamin receptor